MTENLSPFQRWYQYPKNREKKLAYDRKRYRKVRKKRLAQMRAYQKAHQEEIRAYKRDWWRNKKKAV